MKTSRFSIDRVINIQNHKRLLTYGASTLLAAGIFTSTPAAATLRTITAKVISVRTYADGDIHIILSANTLCAPPASSTVLRVGGDGADRVHATALKAFELGRTVNVEYEDQPNGSLCDLSFIRIR